MDSLVASCVAGDSAAMQAIYEQSKSRVYGLMVRMVGQQDADDLTQQVYLQMFRKLGQFNGQSKLETWLFRIATNEALQYLRKQKRQTTASYAVDPITVDDDHLIKGEESQLVEAALKRLDPGLRAVFLLKEQQGLSYCDIAESLGIPEGTVGSRLNRARKELRQELTRLGYV
ncbi:MAG: RNA polymerase sigma factor [Pirellulaceae bacterium]